MIDRRTLAAALRPFLDHGNLDAVAAEIMAETEESHGHANGETWAVYMSLSNTREWNERARQIANPSRLEPAGPVVAAKAKAHAMEQHARRCMGIPREPRGDRAHFLADYMEQSLQRVDWAGVVEMFGEA